MRARNDAFISAIQYGIGEVRSPQFAEAVIPAFSYTHAYVVAAVVAYYELSNTAALTIRRPLEDHVIDNETYALCASYTEDGNTFRYVLNKPLWFDGILFPEYTGQKLGAAAKIEVWTLDDISPAVSADDIVLTIGPLTFQGPGQVTLCGQIPIDSTTLTAVEV